MKAKWKKIGWFIVALLPILILMGLQVICTFTVMMGGMILFILKGNLPMAALMQIQQYTMDHLMVIMIVSQCITAVISGSWYYFVWGRGKKDNWRKKAKAYQILLIPVLGVTIQFMVSSVLTIIDIIAPSLMEKYTELMEQAGLNEITAAMLISTVILAPISEELVCRGLVLRLAQKVSMKFWIINMIQAFAFGIMHGNLIQGTYAFLLGLVLGYIYQKFGNIWLCMLLHAAMNFSSILVAPVFSLFPENLIILSLSLTLAVSTALFALWMFVLKKSE